MVQLKCSHQKSRAATMDSFNSCMVQLKLTVEGVLVTPHDAF